MMHYLKGRTINQQNREAIENSIVGEADLHTMQHERGTSKQPNSIMLECYNMMVHAFECWVEEYNDGLP